MLSANVLTLPANAWMLPANARTLPANVWMLPANVWTLPANVRTLPANAWMLPANVRTLSGYLAREFWFLSRSSFKCRTVRSLEILRNFQLDYFRVTVVRLSIPMIYARNGLAANSLELIIDASFTRRTLTKVPKGSIHFHSFANTIIVRQ